MENGALLSEENHTWFHKQDESVQGYLNAIFQEYKKQVDECTVKFVDFIETPYEVKATEFSIDEKGKYNRTKRKQEDKELIKEWEDNEK